MKKVFKKISDICKMIFGYGIMISLFAGGCTFLGYLAALILGGETASIICRIIYKNILPVVIYLSTIMVLFGLFSMYIAGEFALTPEKKSTGKAEK